MISVGGPGVGPTCLDYVAPFGPPKEWERAPKRWPRPNAWSVLAADVSPDIPSLRDHLAEAIGHADDSAHRSNCLRYLPHRFMRRIAKQYQHHYEERGRKEANLWLLNLSENLDTKTIHMSSNEEALRCFAHNRARDCGRIRARYLDPESAYQGIVSMALSYGIAAPVPGKSFTLKGALARLTDERWWRRQARRRFGWVLERSAIELGMVHRRAGIYASDETVARRRQQNLRNRQLLEETLAVNDLGESFTLAELADLSVSNPRIRRSELMTRARGFENLAMAKGYVGEFITITCPSRMHARHSATGHRNSRYDGTTPREAQQHLCRVWGRIRAKFHRNQIKVFGIRVAEPQHDGTPHWHMLLFMAPEQVRQALAIMRHYALQVDGDERGARKHRFQSLSIDWNRGSGTGYLAKYIAKNIDGHGLLADINGGDAAEAAERVNAWAAQWGIRQFQQIGGPPVSIWRELRRLKKAPDGVMESARKAADAGDWAGFVQAMGGPTCPRTDQSIRLYKAWSDRLGRYGEPVGEQIAGVCAGPVTLPTRIRSWEVRPRAGDSNRHRQVAVPEGAGMVPVLSGPWGRDPTSLGPEDAPERGRGRTPGTSPPWSSVNNCTT